MNEIERLQKENCARLFKEIAKPIKKRSLKPWQLRPEASYFNLKRFRSGL